MTFYHLLKYRELPIGLGTIFKLGSHFIGNGQGQGGVNQQPPSTTIIHNNFPSPPTPIPTPRMDPGIGTPPNHSSPASSSSSSMQFFTDFLNSSPTGVAIVAAFTVGFKLALKLIRRR
jgi:hypothetical protein